MKDESVRHGIKTVKKAPGLEIISPVDEEKEVIEIFGGNLPVCHKP